MGINAEYMGTSVRSSPSIVVRELQVKPPKSQWLSLVLRRRRLTPSTSPLTSMTSREMARLTPSTPATSSCLQLEPHPEDHQGDRRWMRQGREIPDQARCLPHVQGLQGLQGPGRFHDFVEILKLYDKNADDTILEFELFKLLVNLGERLTKEEAKNLMKELCDPADDDGFIPFKPFLEKMC